jgi:hypothetical protein
VVRARERARRAGRRRAAAHDGEVVGTVEVGVAGSTVVVSAVVAAGVGVSGVVVAVPVVPAVGPAGAAGRAAWWREVAWGGWAGAVGPAAAAARATASAAAWAAAASWPWGTIRSAGWAEALEAPAWAVEMEVGEAGEEEEAPVETTAWVRTGWAPGRAMATWAEAVGGGWAPSESWVRGGNW